jgi:hypothetical protein
VCGVVGLFSIALYITELIGVGPSAFPSIVSDVRDDDRVELDAEFSLDVATENNCVRIFTVDMKDRGSQNLIIIYGRRAYVARSSIADPALAYYMDCAIC